MMMRRVLRLVVVVVVVVVMVGAGRGGGAWATLLLAVLVKSFHGSERGHRATITAAIAAGGAVTKQRVVMPRQMLRGIPSRRSSTSTSTGTSTSTSTSGAGDKEGGIINIRAEAMVIGVVGSSGRRGEERRFVRR